MNSGAREAGHRDEVRRASARRSRSWRVPPEAAHKRRAENLWLTTATREDGALSVEFEIPAAESPLRFAELMEVQRQAAIVYAHRVLGVAGDAVFVLSAISLELASDAGNGPLPERGGTIIVRPTPPTSLQTATASAQFEMTTGARATAHGSVEARFLSPRVYARLRATTVASPTAPAPSPPSTRQDFDLRDPLVTDHDVDHVPAMAIISRLEQSLITDASRVGRLHLQFRSYLETHLPASLDIDDHGHGEFSGHARQAGQVKATFHGRVYRTCTGTSTRRVSV